MELVRSNIVGYAGRRAVIHEVLEETREVVVLYREQLPPAECPDCKGRGEVRVAVLGCVSCDRCEGRGELLAREVLQRETVSIDELTRPPAEAEHPLARATGKFLSNPQAIFDEEVAS